MQLLVQPYGGSLGKLLAAGLNSGSFQSFMLSVAYARLSGVEALSSALRSFRASGGSVRAAVGIDQRNTSREALLALLELADELLIFHNRSRGSTFHPKVYVLGGERRAKICTGSGNLTGGGLYTNYEVCSCVEYDLSDARESAEFAGCIDALAPFFREGPCCRRADEALIQRLYDARLLSSEEEMRLIPGDGEACGDSVFGTEHIAGGAPRHAFARRSREAHAQLEAAHTDEAPRTSFYKRLSRNDVDLRSSPGQIIIPIGFKPFFEPLSEPQKTRAGALQSERFLNVKFENTGEIIENARVIFYVPSPQAPRKNSEVRFALRSRRIFAFFRQGDVLVFTSAPRGMQGQYACSLRIVPGDNAEAESFPTRFGWLER